MNIGLLMLLALGALAGGYFLYGRFLAGRAGVDPNRPTPAVQSKDPSEYTPTRPLLLFGHHFASVAFIAVIGGPLPAVLALVVGAIFIGGAHDFSALLLNVRGRPTFPIYAGIAVLVCGLAAGTFLDRSADALTYRHSLTELGLEHDQTLLDTQNGVARFGLWDRTRFEENFTRAERKGASPDALQKLRELWPKATAAVGGLTILDKEVGADEALGETFARLGLAPPVSTDAVAQWSDLDFSERSEQARTLGSDDAGLFRAKTVHERARAIRRARGESIGSVEKEFSYAIAEIPTMGMVVHNVGITEGVMGGIAATPVVVITLFAPLLGFLLYRKGLKLWLAGLLSIAVAGVSFAAGFWLPVAMSVDTWKGVGLFYGLVAAIVPVWTLLQSRDFINAHLLGVGTVAMIIGVLAGGFDEPVPVSGEWIWLALAVGCASGINGMVAITSGRQLDSERSALPIGYGGLLLAAAAGVAVILCVAIGGNGVGSSIGVTLSRGLGIPTLYGTVFGLLLFSGFLLTTADTLIRAARILVQELGLKHPVLSALVAVVPAGAAAFLPLAEAFLAANVLLGAMTLWLIRPKWWTMVPAVISTLGAGALLIHAIVAGELHTKIIAGALLAGGVAFAVSRYTGRARIYPGTPS